MRNDYELDSNPGSCDAPIPIIRKYDENHPYEFEWRAPPQVEGLTLGPAMRQLEKRAPFPASYFPPHISVNACYVFDQCGMKAERVELLSKYQRSWVTQDSLRKSTLGYSHVKYAPAFNDSRLDEAIEFVRDEFVHALKEPLKSWTIEKVMKEGDMPKNTSPGLPYIQQGYRSKADVWKDHHQDIEEEHIRIREGYRPRTPDCAAFARSIVCEKPKNKVRLVWAYPLEQVLLEAKYVQPLLQAMTSQKIGQTVAYGAETMRGGMEWLNTELHSLPRQNYICIDFSSFDQTVPAWLIRIAFDILEECFTTTEVEDVNGRIVKTNDRAVAREWRQIKHYFINTPLRMEDGTRYEKTGGVPSGSCFTNIVDSIVNMIVMRYVLMSTAGEWPNFLTVLGDDSVTATTGLVNLNDMAQVAKDKFGMIINVEKSYWTQYIGNVQFLGYYNHHGYPARDEDTLLAGLLLPDSSVDESLALTAARFLGISQASCGASRACIKLTKYLFRELERRGKNFVVDAQKLYHIQKAGGWLPAAGEKPEPLPAVPFLEYAVLPKHSCEKLKQGIRLAR
nr:MAG: putative RNA dependent RNA polymerase [Hameenlinna partiti-like virus]